MVTSRLFALVSHWLRNPATEGSSGLQSHAICCAAWHGLRGDPHPERVGPLATNLTEPIRFNGDPGSLPVSRRNRRLCRPASPLIELVGVAGLVPLVSVHWNSLRSRCNRLTLPKYLLKEAQRVIERRETPHSWGLATSLLQDSVEIFLRLLAAHYGIPVGRFEAFDKLLDKVGNSEMLACVADHKAGLNRLNSARVSFKHEGLGVVDAHEAQGFVSTVEGFLNEV